MRAENMFSQIIMECVVKELVIVTAVVSPRIECEMRCYCGIIYVMSNLKKLNHITLQSSVF